MPGSDAVHVRAALAGDAQALDVLVAAYLPLVYNIVGRVLDAPGEVDDTVQDVMLHVIRDLRQLREPEAFPVMARGDRDAAGKRRLAPAAGGAARRPT